jgi:hypothetical protein
MALFSYVVRCELDDEALAARYLAWLRDEGHVAEVCAVAGASATIVRLDPPLPPRIEVRYRFPSREAFAAYERDHAPRLRGEGRVRFPRGARFIRESGEILGEFGASPEARRGAR